MKTTSLFLTFIGCAVLMPGVSFADSPGQASGQAASQALAGNGGPARSGPASAAENGVASAPTSRRKDQGNIHDAKSGNNHPSGQRVSAGHFPVTKPVPLNHSGHHLGGPVLNPPRTSVSQPASSLGRRASGPTPTSSSAVNFQSSVSRAAISDAKAAAARNAAVHPSTFAGLPESVLKNGRNAASSLVVLGGPANPARALMGIGGTSMKRKP